MQPIAIIVDDDAGVLFYLRKLLEKRGLRVISIASFSAAVERIRGMIIDKEKAEAVLFIVSDYTIKGEMLNGLSFLDCFNGLFPKAKRLVFSANDVAEKAIALGYAFISKGSIGFTKELENFFSEGEVPRVEKPQK